MQARPPQDEDGVWRSRPKVHPQARRQAGFTLLELLVVTAILGLIAYAALDTVAQDTSPVRFEDTRTRLVAIRNAVLGGAAPGQAQSAAGYATGFIADMGRVPKDPQELMTMPVDASGTPLMPTWQLDIHNDPISGLPVGTGLGAGWRGPYLHAFRETRCVSSDPTTCTTTNRGRAALRDGWGNTVSGEPIDDPTHACQTSFTSSTVCPDLFGWRRFWPDLLGNLYVQSYGADGVPDQEVATNLPELDALDLYSRDYPPAAPAGSPPTVTVGGRPDPLVAARDYQISLLTPVTLSIHLTNASGGDILLPSYTPPPDYIHTPGDILFDANTYVCASLHYVSEGEVKAVFTSVDTTALPEVMKAGESRDILLTVPVISSSALTDPAIPPIPPTPPQNWLPAGAVALRLRSVVTTAAVTSNTRCVTPSGSPAPLLKHTYDNTGRCKTDDPNNLNLSPGLACGTSIIPVVPPVLPQQINMSLTWPWQWP